MLARFCRNGTVMYMIRFTRGYIFLTFSIGVFILTPFFIAHAGFGVSPPRLEEDRLVPGSSVTRTIYLVQGNPESDVPILASVESSTIKDWVSLEQGSEFTIPRGVQQFPFKITIKVPEETELGKYEAVVRVRTNPNPQEGDGNVAIAIGGRIDIDVTVGDDVLVEYNVKSIDILDITEGDPLQVQAVINNTGNVSSGPDSATFELFDKFGNTRLAFVTAENTQFSRVPPFSEEAVVLSFALNTVIAQGEYRGHVKIYDADGTVLRELRKPFNVLERTTLDFIMQYLIYVVTLLVVVIAIVVWRIRKNKGSTLNDSHDNTTIGTE